MREVMFFIASFFTLYAEMYLGIEVSAAAFSFPFVTQMSPKGYIGTYTGLYYLFSSLANIVSPPLLGLLFDKVGYGCMFIYGTIFMGICLIMMTKVKE